MVKAFRLLLFLAILFGENAWAQRDAYAIGMSADGLTAINFPEDYEVYGPKLPRATETTPPVFYGRFFIGSSRKKVVAFLSCHRLGFQDYTEPDLKPEDQAIASLKSHLARLTSWSGQDLIITSCPPAEEVNSSQIRGWIQIINHKPKLVKITMGSGQFKGLYHSPPSDQPLSCKAIACVIVGARMVFEIELYGPSEKSTHEAINEIIISLRIPTQQAVSAALSKQGRIECTLALKSGAILKLRLPPGYLPDKNVDLAKGTYELSFPKNDDALRYTKADASASVIIWQDRHRGKRHQAGALLNSPLGWLAARTSNYLNALFALQRPPIPFSTQVRESDMNDVISTQVFCGRYGHDFAAICEVITDGGDVLHCTVAADSRPQMEEILSNLSEATYLRK
jgi:hypothetical protein